MTSAVWDDATARYGERIHPRIATKWPGGGNTSANVIWAWDAHTNTGGYGFLGLASVGLTPDDPEQQRVDLAVYWLQIKVTATDDPTRCVGELHKVLDPFPMPARSCGPVRTAARSPSTCGATPRSRVMTSTSSRRADPWSERHH